MRSDPQFCQANPSARVGLYSAPPSPAVNWLEQKQNASTEVFNLTGDVPMSSQRVDDALSRLIEGLTLYLEDEDEASADDKFQTNLEHARSTLDAHTAPAVTQDVAHVSELIKRKLVRDHDTPDNALKFGNLYSRFLSKPVLRQKWAILQLLSQLSEPENPSLSTRRIKPTPIKTSVPTHLSPDSARARENGVFDEAFSRHGLRNMQSPSRAVSSPRKHNDAHSPRIEPERRRRRDVVYGDTTTPDGEVAYGSQTLRSDSSEPGLLRDLPFTLQGISSTNLQFSSSNTLKMPSSIPAPIISLLHSLAEPSLLYRGLASFQESSGGGLVGQSLRAALGVEMRSYLSLVATLEGQIRRALAMLEESNSQQTVGKAGVTLKRCVIWTREATLGLRLMSLLVDESKSRRGGQIISLIHSFASSHGDPFVSSFAERLLSHTTRPFYDMLRLWIYDGELSDPHLEFFVSEQQETDEDEGRGAATSVWENKYKLDETMIPSIISEEFARKVFLIGKSLNFIRYACGDSAWVESYSKEASRELRYGDTATLETSIDLAYKTTMTRLIHLMNTKFKLQQHLVALRKYLLLGQGDFIALLMESLASNLDRPANSQYRHTLTAQLEHAIRNSNAQYDSSDVLRRLDARMLELSHGEIGWDVFTLEYKVDAPVDVIVSPWASKQYLKVFNFLWRVKRVEFALGVTWRRCMTGARGTLIPAESEEGGMGKDWKTARCVIAEMIHFIFQLQYYILFEVIEASWDALHKELERPGATLDDLIAAHTKYLRSITRKGLLGSGSSIDFTTQLHELLKTMLAYKDAVDGLFSHSMHISSRHAQKKARIETRTRQGQWGVTERDDDDDDPDAEYNASQNPRDRLNAARSSPDSPLPPPLLNIDGLNGGAGAHKDAASNGDVLPALRQRLSTLELDFRARVCGLLGDLAHQPDQDMRFLGVVMNFNDTYKVVRRGRRKGPHTAGTSGGSTVAGGGTERKRTAASTDAQAEGSGTVRKAQMAATPAHTASGNAAASQGVSRRGSQKDR